MFNETFKQELFEYIESSGIFRITDFDVKEGTSYSNAQLRIEYKYIDNYYFDLSVPQNTKKYTILYSPGEVTREEKVMVDGKYTIYSTIQEWTRLFKEEMLNKGVNKAFSLKIDKHEEMIEKLNEKVNEMEDGSFTKDEAEKWIERIESLEAQLNENLSNLKEENKSIRNEVEKVKMELQLLRNTVNVMEKKKWIKMFGNKVITWVNNPENKEVLKLGKNVAKMALPDEIKDIIPQD